ncbi:MAG: acyl-CoA dehydrogenase, partial [Caldilineaceae bacterium]|nr:acyl-CoA dehydrogenase [Caldilineaceae bacterium]
MPIEFRMPDTVEKQLQPVRAIAEHVMRPESRLLDEHEHTRPVKFIHMMWPHMQKMEQTNLESALARARRRQNGHEAGAETPRSDKPNIANLSLIHLIEMLSWGDAGVYLCIPSSALAGAAIHAVAEAEQLEHFLRRFTEGEPKWGAMAMTEPQAGSDTSNIQTTATFDPATNEWVLN